MENYEVYIRKFKIPLGILAVTILLFIILIMQIAPNIEKISTIQKNTKSQTTAIADLERRLADLKKAAKEKNAPETNLLKEFFRPINGGVDTETAIADEFGEILDIMRENKIKARSIKSIPDPQDDNFVKFASNRYHVYSVTADMIGSYSAFGNFLRDLYKHEHFLEISKIEIVPYNKNKKILLANLQLKLYAQRTSSSVPYQSSVNESNDEAANSNNDTSLTDSNNSDEQF